MAILNLKKVIDLAEFYNLYVAFLKSQLTEKEANSVIAKIKTSLLRYVLPEYGFLLKLDGNLAPGETIEGLKLLGTIPIYQIAYLREAQERVFNRFGDRVSPASRRVYRSALRKMMEWGETQDWWKQSVETSSDGRTPTMLVAKKRVEHWYKLKPKELLPPLSQQFDGFSIYCTTLRQRRLSESSYLRYYREVLGALGWMHRVKGVALADLSLTNLVPVAAIEDPDAAVQVVALVQEYLDWMRVNLGANDSSLRFALQAFLYIAEYIHHEYTQNA